MTHDMEEPAALAGARGLEGNRAPDRAFLQIAPQAEPAKPGPHDPAAAEAARGDPLRHLLPSASEPPTFLAGLPVDLQRELEELARDVETTATEAMVSMGESLSRARELLANHPEGGFGEYCETRLGMPARRARDLISVFECLGHDGARALRGHSRRAVINLASPSMPAEVRDQVIRDAARGKIHTAAEIKVLKERFEKFKRWDECFEGLKPLRRLPGPTEIYVAHNGGFHSSQMADIDNRSNVYIFQSDREPDRFYLVCHDSRADVAKTVAFEPYDRDEVDHIFGMADLCLSRLYDKILFFTKPLSTELRNEFQQICDQWNPPGRQKRRNCAHQDD